MQLSTVNDWLICIKEKQQQEIVLGLDRIKIVANKLGLLPPLPKTIVVAGTNGKGSVCATLESIYLSANYQVGCFTSPYLFDFSEQIRINKNPTAEYAICQAFNIIEKACDNILLTPFEYTTLAALWIFKEADLDLIILEVGLGGRLDAVNIIDADLAIVTSIGLDHQEFLGSTRELIAYEKAGILRPKQNAIFIERDLPKSLIESANKHETNWFSLGKDFDFEDHQTHFSFINKKLHRKRLNLTNPSLSLENVAGSLMAIETLQDTFPVTISDINDGLKKIKWPARLQSVKNEICIEIYDVAHNPDSAKKLSEYLKVNAISGKTIAIFSMLSQKDIYTTISIMNEVIDEWFVAPLKSERTIAKNELEKNCASLAINYDIYEDMQSAYVAAQKRLNREDRLVIFGSFHTVSEVARLNPIAYQAMAFSSSLSNAR